MSDTARAMDQQEIQKLIQQGKLPDALRALDGLDADDRNSQMNLYMRGVCLRHLRQWADAEKVLHQLIAKSPSYGRGFQELGHLYRDAGRQKQSVPTQPPVILTRRLRPAGKVNITFSITSALWIGWHK